MEELELQSRINDLQSKNASLEFKIGRMEDDFNRSIDKAIACLQSVKAMLNHSKSGATHRMKEFYADAMVSYMQSVIGDLSGSKINRDEYPF